LILQLIIFIFIPRIEEWKNTLNSVDILSGIFSKKENISSEPSSTFSKIRDPLIEASLLFRAKHKRPMVLVLDSVDILAENDSKFMEILQKFAMNCADMASSLSPAMAQFFLMA
jgi:hypothetical protein